MKSNLWFIVVMTVALATGACAKLTGSEDSESSESEIFQAIENGTEASQSSSAYQAFGEGGGGRRRGQESEEGEGEFRKPRLEKKFHFRRLSHKIRESNPNVIGVVGLSLRNPVEENAQADEEDYDGVSPALCQVDLTIASNLTLKVEREPKKLEDIAPATVSADGKSIVISREAKRTRLILSLALSDAEELPEIPTLSLSGTLGCASGDIAVDQDLTSYIEPGGRPRFKIREAIGDALLRGIGVMFPPADPEEEFDF